MFTYTYQLGVIPNILWCQISNQKLGALQHISKLHRLQKLQIAKLSTNLPNAVIISETVEKGIVE
jgi:hypothetical protein